jgi:hypothetical protein
MAKATWEIRGEFGPIYLNAAFVESVTVLPADDGWDFPVRIKMISGAGYDGNFTSAADRNAFMVEWIGEVKYLNAEPTYEPTEVT